MSEHRSLRAKVRNPLLLLPAAKKLAVLLPESERALRALLLEIKTQARVRAHKCWAQHKAPMAVYWKAIGVCAIHTSRLLREGRDEAW